MDVTSEFADKRKTTTAFHAQLEAARCLACYDAPCSKACPAGVDVVGFIRRIRTGNLGGAIALVRQSNILAEVCGYLCPTETLCMEECCRSGLDRPIPIGRLQAFAGRYQRLHGLGGHQYVRSRGGERVAVVGAGPAGLGAAARLLDLGYEVEIFDRNEFPGGRAMYAIPAHRLNKQVLLFEALLVEQAGAVFNLNTEVDDTSSLLNKFVAVVVAAGWGSARRLEVEGEDLDGVYDCGSFLRAVCEAELLDRTVGLALGQNVLVFGGGNTAVDCAVVARRLGASRVTVMYRRTHNEMPARKREVYRAMSEGVEFRHLVQPVRMRGENGHLTAIECVEMELGHTAEASRPIPVPVADSGFLVTADSAIVAVGYESRLSAAKQRDACSGLPKGVFVCGGAGNRHGSVVEALSSGRVAADAVHQYLSSPEERLA